LNGLPFSRSITKQSDFIEIWNKNIFAVSLNEVSFEIIMTKSTEPKRLPLTIILIGTTLLAIPAAFGTIALFDTSSPGTSKDVPVNILFWVSISGFVLFSGYILTAVFRQYSCIFWLCSLIYNLGLSCCYIYFFIAEAASTSVPVNQSLFNFWRNPLLVLPLWTIFVAAASGYYLKFALLPKKSNLP
jgi:hypothetical protein